MKFAYDIAAVGLISNNDESACTEEAEQLAMVQRQRYQSIYLLPNKKCLLISGRPVFASQSLTRTWPFNTACLAKKVQEHLHFLWSIRNANCPLSSSPCSTGELLWQIGEHLRSSSHHWPTTSTAATRPLAL